MFDTIDVVCAVSAIVIGTITFSDFDKDPLEMLKKHLKCFFLVVGIAILIRLVYDAVLV